ITFSLVPICPATDGNFDMLDVKDFKEGGDCFVRVVSTDGKHWDTPIHLEFTQQESCGKCSFCRLGTQQMLNILNRIVQGEGQKEDLELLQELAEGIKLGSLCNLGKNAPNPVLSSLKHFRSEYLAHIEKKQCPALACSALIEYYILPERCERSCDICLGKCPVEAIFSNEHRIKVIDPDKCIKCDSCLPVCPPQYQAIIKRPKYT
ncbi:MAG: 4Fe-4S binding protein, partial [Clostridia bacterium]|nr:4Fe-4S binding protein [Clostridia bacterium]